MSRFMNSPLALVYTFRVLSRSLPWSIRLRMRQMMVDTVWISDSDDIELILSWSVFAT